jgi:aminocarboxymuconate-semialdehyde decarboxylase
MRSIDIHAHLMPQCLWPQRFAGLATLPVQDVGAAVDELERAVQVLGLKGAELDTVVNVLGL